MQAAALVALKKLLPNNFDEEWTKAMSLNERHQPRTRVFNFLYNPTCCGVRELTLLSPLWVERGILAALYSGGGMLVYYDGVHPSRPLQYIREHPIYMELEKCGFERQPMFFNYNSGNNVISFVCKVFPEKM